MDHSEIRLALVLVALAATASLTGADIVRTRVAPLLIPRAMAFEAVREALFRTVSQITLNYRDI